MRPADGHVGIGAGAAETAGSILHGVEGSSRENGATGQWSLPMTTAVKSSGVSGVGMVEDAEGSGFVETNIRRGKTESIISTGTESSGNSTVGPRTEASTSSIDFPGSESSSDSRGTPPVLPNGTVASPPANDSLTWTSALGQAMRSMLRPASDALSPSSRPSSPSNFKKHQHHGLLSTDPLLIDERPHIKYDWTIGKRLKFSCTVYYAKQFDALRKRCGIDDVFVRSMRSCECWAADGGKSKSNFYRTGDERFIIKTLVNAWNVADL